MLQLLPVELILFLGFTIFAGLIYLLIISFRSRNKNASTDDEEDDGPAKPDDDDPEWRAKRFWWFGR